MAMIYHDAKPAREAERARRAERKAAMTWAVSIGLITDLTEAERRYGVSRAGVIDAYRESQGR